MSVYSVYCSVTDWSGAATCHLKQIVGVHKKIVSHVYLGCTDSNNSLFGKLMFKISMRCFICKFLSRC